MATYEQTILPIPPREEDAGSALQVPSGYTEAFGKNYPRYPRSDYSSGFPMLAALGSFWLRYFGDKGEVRSYLQMMSIQMVQTYIDYLETVACLSRFECPVFHRREWYALTIKESTFGTGDAALLKYDADGDSDYDGQFQYGVPTGNKFFAVPLSEIKNIAVLTNKIIDASVAWVNGSDFFFDNGNLVLRQNPFDDSRIPVRTITDKDGAVIDREIVLWAFSALEDYEYIYQHYGYAIRRKFESSETYKDLVNSLWNGFAGGLATSDLEWALAAVAGIPSVKETTETVEVILQQMSKTVVVTDKHSYIYPKDSVAKFPVGTTVYAGQALVDTVCTFDLANYEDIVDLLTRKFVTDSGEEVSTGKVVSSSSAGAVLDEYLAHRFPSRIKPPADDQPLLQVLPIGKGLLGAGYSGPLGFWNTVGRYDQSETDADGDAIGKIKPIEGAEADVDKLWNDTHAAGVAAGKRWLQYYKLLPKYVNPAGFAIEQFLRNHAVVVYLRYTKFSEDVLCLTTLDLLRRVLPPEKTVIYLVDLEAEETRAIDVDPCDGDPDFVDTDSSSSGIQCNEAAEIATMFADSPLGRGFHSSSSATLVTDSITDLEPVVFYPDACE